jgi:hypothetical protein
MPAIRATYTFLIDEPRSINPYQLTLALLMPRVGADHSNNTLAANDLAVPADFLY